MFVANHRRTFKLRCYDGVLWESQSVHTSHDLRLHHWGEAGHYTTGSISIRSLVYFVLYTIPRACLKTVSVQVQ